MPVLGRPHPGEQTLTLNADDIVNRGGFDCCAPRHGPAGSQPPAAPPGVGKRVGHRNCLGTVITALTVSRPKEDRPDIRHPLGGRSGFAWQAKARPSGP